MAELIHSTDSNKASISVSQAITFIHVHTSSDLSIQLTLPLDSSPEADNCSTYMKYLPDTEQYRALAADL